jgi:hypothetical protein
MSSAMAKLGGAIILNLPQVVGSVGIIPKGGDRYSTPTKRSRSGIDKILAIFGDSLR